MITVKVNDEITYTLESLWWKGPQGGDLDFLNTMATEFWLDEVSAADPDPDLTHAQAAIEALGKGEIIKHTAPASADGRIY